MALHFRTLLHNGSVFWLVDVLLNLVAKVVLSAVLLLGGSGWLLGGSYWTESCHWHHTVYVLWSKYHHNIQREDYEHTFLSEKERKSVAHLFI